MANLEHREVEELKAEGTWWHAERTPEERMQKAQELMMEYSVLMHLDRRIYEDLKNGIIDVSYMKTRRSCKVLHLDDEPEIKAKAKKIEKAYNCTVYHAIADGKHEPVFLAVSEDNRSSMRQCDWACFTDWRDIHFNVYFLLEDGTPVDGVNTVDGHNGIMYMVKHNPSLQEKDWNIHDKFYTEPLKIIKEYKCGDFGSLSKLFGNIHATEDDIEHGSKVSQPFSDCYGNEVAL